MSRPGGRDRGIFERPAGSGVWYARWHDQSGREHKEKAGSKTAARQIYALRKAAALEGRKLPDLRRLDLTVADLVDQYEPEILTRNQKSSREYTRQGKLWRAELGPRLASRVTAGEIERWKAARLQTKAPATVNLSLRYLKMLFNLALRDDLVEKNPLARGRVKEVREQNQRDRILTPEEEALLAEHLPRALWLKLVIALHTGLRQSEQFGLKRKSVDLGRRLVCLENAKGARRGEKQWVRLNAPALAALTEVLEEHGGSPWVWPARHGEGPVDGTSITKRLQRACAKLGLAEGITWHCLRHTFISRLCMMAVPLPTVQKLARHKSITMTLRYAHLCPNHEEEALAGLVRFGSEPEPKPEQQKKAPDESQVP